MKLYDHNHKFELASKIPFKDQGFTAAPITIGNNCWIGSNVTILAGAEIGDNVVVGANTVICKKIPANTIVTGSNTLSVRANMK